MLGLFILWRLRVFYSGRFLLPHLLSEKHKIQEKFNHHLRSLTGHFIGVKKLAPSPSFDSTSFIATPTLNKISGGSTCTTVNLVLFFTYFFTWFKQVYYLRYFFAKAFPSLSLGFRVLHPF